MAPTDREAPPRPFTEILEEVESGFRGKPIESAPRVGPKTELTFHTAPGTRSY